MTLTKIKGGLLHLDVSKEFLSCVFKRCTKDIDHIVNNQETIVIVQGNIATFLSNSQGILDN